MRKKRPTSIRIDEQLLKKAHERGLNVIKICENALREAIAKLEKPISQTEYNRGGSRSEGPLSSPEVSSTFSMVARCPRTLALGVCVSTAVPKVRSRVPHVEAGVGAIATQAKTKILYGTNGLKLLKMGFPPKSALEAMLERDPDRESRQVIIIDKDERKAAFTGKETIDWKGHLIDKDYVVAGNLLVGGRVVKAMAQTFESSEGLLADRLMRALEAGQEAGGDKRGRVSAALLVASNKRKGAPPILDLRVDEHKNPVAELRRVFESYKKETKAET
jgi:uncharacterized Ntn-hydrolase superfamily protein/post-segregation antitoxin (ccd killing protein)